MIARRALARDQHPASLFHGGDESSARLGGDDGGRIIEQRPGRGAHSLQHVEGVCRQEPAARLVRSVGPNLVVALLLGGEQIEKRWPARYAAVLAEDPGSSVLSITSLGMARLNPKASKAKTSIALWRDSEGIWPVEMPRNAKGMVLSL